MLEGDCEDIYDESFCAGFGEAIFLNAKGEPSCECQEGWGRRGKWEEKVELVVWGGNKDIVKKDRVKTGGRCYQEYTQGFCTGNMIVKEFEENLFGCINNPCEKSKHQLPH